ncbi:MAG: hypothetical protein WD826_07645, partial [Actinomycetota bacterium]
GPLFVGVLGATALILFLAANTSYADFPRLSSVLARDRFWPRQFMNRGDRLAFSNGISDSVSSRRSSSSSSTPTSLSS